MAVLRGKNIGRGKGRMLKCRSKEQEILDLHVVTPAYNAPAPIFVRSHCDSAHQAPSMHCQPQWTFFVLEQAELDLLLYSKWNSKGVCEYTKSEAAVWRQRLLNLQNEIVRQFLLVFITKDARNICVKKWKILQCRSWYRQPMRRLAISCRQSCAIRQYHIFNDAICASVWLEM